MSHNHRSIETLKEMTGSVSIEYSLKHSSMILIINLYVQDRKAREGVNKLLIH